MRTDILSTSSASALVRPSTTTATAPAAQAQSSLAAGAAGSVGGVADSGAAKANAANASIDVNPSNKADPTLAADSSEPDDAGTTPDAAQLKQSVADLNLYAQPRQGSIEFSLDETTGKTLLKVIDKETNTVLLQVPSKEALALSQSIGKTTGLLIQDSA